MACTPIGVSPPQGVSSLSARQASGFRNSAFGKVIVASKCRSVPSVPGLDLLAQLGHLRMEAPVVAEAERDPGLLRWRRPRLPHRPCAARRASRRRRACPPSPPRSSAPRAGSAASPAPPHRCSCPPAAPRSCRPVVSVCASLNAFTSGDTVRVAPATKRIWSLSATASTSVRPHQPIPTIAALIIHNSQRPNHDHDTQRQ